MPLHHAAPAVAAGLVFEFEQHKIVDARQPQRPRRCQPGHATPGDDDLRAPHHAGRGQLARLQPVAQRMAARQVDTRKAALQRARRLMATGQSRGSGSGGKKLAALHGVCL